MNIYQIKYKLRTHLSTTSRVFCTLFLLFVLFSLFSCNPVGAIAKQSSLTVNISDDLLLVDMQPSIEGHFVESSSNTISITTDNYSGYTFSVATKDSTSMLNSNDDAIESISSAISESVFTNNSSYNNKWGFKPEQYVTTANNVSTVVQNTSFLPAPSTNGDVIAATNSPNSVADTYDLSFGVKVDYDLPAGTYEYTYSVIVLANPAVYNITYDENTNDAVTNMPSPNPQVINIDGTTPAAESIAILSENIPIKNGKKFAGWCDVQTVVDAQTGDHSCSGTTYPAGGIYGIDQTADGSNITLYAIWVDTLFPVVWNQMGECEFHGATNGNITGSACTDYSNVRFIDTGIALYSSQNYLKDYEIHFKINHYSPSEQVNYYGDEDNGQQTFVSDKISSNATSSTVNKTAPGIVVRRNSGNSIEINNRMNDTPESYHASYTTFHEVSVYRINNIVYYSVDGGPLVELQDITGFTETFGRTVWFGAYAKDACTGDGGVTCTNAKRIIEADLSEMYIKLGEASDELFQISFDGNGGTASAGSLLVFNGNSLTNANLPTATLADHVFVGWYDDRDNGNLIQTPITPSGNETYYAHWQGTVALANITNDTISVAPGSSETINVTNSASIEPYTFTSNDTSIATVNTTTGEVTAVSFGNTTITMTGTLSGETRTIDVSVLGTHYTVSFDAQGGRNVADIEVVPSGTISDIPFSQKSGSIFEGWYTGPNGAGSQLDTTTPITSNITYYAYWTPGEFVCKIASELHEESCSRTDSNGCRGGGYRLNDPIQYGRLVDSATMVLGDAYNCDVNNDTNYNAANERFYFIGMNGNNASFIYYTNMDHADYQYDPSLALLPTSDTNSWPNPNLVSFSGTRVARYPTRAEVQANCNDNATLPTGIGNNGKCVWLVEQSNFSVSTRRDGIWLEKEGNTVYRIQTKSRAVTSNTTANAPRPVIEVPLKYVERGIDPSNSVTIHFDSHGGSGVPDMTIASGDQIGTLPSAPTYQDHVFQGWFTAASGGTMIDGTETPTVETTYHAQWLKSVAIANLASDAFTILEGGTATINVTNAAELEGYTFTSSDPSIATVNSSTGLITGVVDGTTTIIMEGGDSGAQKTITVRVADPSSVYTLSFDSHCNVTVPDQIVIIGDQIGTLPSAPTCANHVFQGWFTAASGGTMIDGTETPSGNTTYHAQWKLDVTQAIITNNDLTLSVGGQITVGVSNSADLEPYTFSSANSSIATIDSTTGVIEGIAAGTTSITITGTNSGAELTLPVEVTSAPVTEYTVTYNPNGGSSVNPSRIASGSPVGSLPTTTKSDYKFFGWYTDDGTFYNEVTPDTVVTGDVTYYAKWVEDTTSFPIVWSEVNSCIFRGSNTLEGDYCTQDKTKSYIDTGIQLFTSQNYDKDFEIGFTIVTYDPSSQSTATGDAGGKQATFVNTKLEDSANNYPGIVVRRESGTNQVQITQKWKGDSGNTDTFAASTFKTIRIVRRKVVINGTNHYKILYSVNGGSEVDFQDITSVTRFPFDTKVWFGASTASDDISPMRPLVGELMDMYIRLGTETSYNIRFDANGGSVSETFRNINIGDQLGSLPTPTHDGNYTFDGWYTAATGGTQVTASTTPDHSTTYYAHWTYVSTMTPVVFDVSNDATRGYNQLINGMKPQVSQFNEDTTTVDQTQYNRPSINWSTWGVAKTTFMNALKNNFETNNCMLAPGEDSAFDWGGGHAVNCSKPDVYDTSMNAALNVYLYDTATSTIDNQQVAYAQADNGIIHNMIPGKSYYWEKASDNTVYGVVTATAPDNRRWLDVGNVWNVRDLGGLPVDTDNDGVNDGTVVYEKLIRGARLNTSSSNIGLLQDLGVDKEYDLTDSNELSGDVQFSGSSYVNDPAVHYNFNYGTAGYTSTRQAVTDIMTEVARNNNNIYFHCRVGADRTGTLAYLLEGLLGVPDEDRYEDYEMTSLAGLNDRTRYYDQKANNNHFKFLYMMGYVLTTQDIYDWYMAGSQNTTADDVLIQDFRNAMIESAP